MLRSLLSARLAFAIAVVAAVSVVAGPALAARSHAAATVTVTATEFKFKLSPSTVTHGKVIFTLVNKGKVAHDFQIAGKKAPLVSPGKSAKLTVTLKARQVPLQVHGRRTRGCRHEGHTRRQVALCGGGDRSPPPRRYEIAVMVMPPATLLHERSHAPCRLEPRPPCIDTLY